MFRSSKKMSSYQVPKGLKLVNCSTLKLYTMIILFIILAAINQRVIPVKAFTLSNLQEEQAQSSTAISSDDAVTIASNIVQNSNTKSASIGQYEPQSVDQQTEQTQTVVPEHLRRSIQLAQAQKKLIKSRYRSRAYNRNGQQLAGTSNYSQPFDSGAAPTVSHQTLARALSAGTPVAESPVAYTYLPASSQRAPVHMTGESSSSGLLLDDGPSVYNQDISADYTPPLQQTAYRSNGMMAPAAGTRMYSPVSRMHGGSAMSAGDLNLPLFMASPSMSSAGYSDYYGSGSNDHHTSDYDHYVPRSMLSNFSDLDSSSPYYPSAQDISPLFSSPTSSYLGNRNRWSWPWTDVSSSFGSGSGPMTSATFKKHHHHHLPAQHKEHDHHHHHHEEHDHLMSKWEHGISIGEIACIAIAVILGVIILGSPFFLLFLMLFNGGNIFGSTQMGLLAPAATPGGGSGAAGKRRRRKRSLNEAKKSGISGEELAKLRELDLHSIGEYLFEKLSPFMDADKLMRSFERIASVKDDIGHLVSKLGPQLEAYKLDSERKLANEKEESHRHIEMRRRRKK